MSFSGMTGAQRDPELVRLEAAAKQERLQAEAEARHRRREARPGRLRRMLRPILRIRGVRGSR